jgi:hypothetical protein
MDGNSEGDGQKALEDVPGTPLFPKYKAPSLPDRIWGITKPPQRTTQRPIGAREPLRDISKQFQILTGEMEKAVEQQALAQQQAQRGDFETLWGQVRETISSLRAELQLRDESYQGKIASLEQEVSRLRTELTTAMKATQPAQMPIPTASPAPAHGPPSGAATNTQDQAHSRPRQADRARDLPERKAPSYADVAALMATRPGGQGWQIVPPKQKKASKQGSIGDKALEPKDFKPAKEKDKVARRLLFRRDKGNEAPKAEREEVILALNRALAREGLPGFIRVVDAGYTETGAMSVLLERGALGAMLVPYYRDLLVAAACQVDSAVVSVELPEQWHRIKVHGVPTRRYLTLGLGLAREEIELGTEFKLKRDPIWLRNPKDLRDRDKKGSTIVVTVGTIEEA